MTQDGLEGTTVKDLAAKVKEPKSVNPNAKVAKSLAGPNGKFVSSQPSNISVANLEPKPGNRLALCGSLNGQMVLANTLYKVQRVRSNGDTLVLKRVGKLQ